CALLSFLNYTTTAQIYTLSLHDALPISVTQFCRKLAAERPLKDIRDEYNYPKKKGIKDECSRLLEASTMKSRRGFAIQRLNTHQIGRAVQQECRDRARMPSSA